jgi:ferritin
MKLDSVILEALNVQANRERQNVVPYHAMAVRCDFMALRGLGKFFAKSAREEGEHAQKLIDYIIDRNDEPTLTTLTAVTLPATPDLSTLGSTFLYEALSLEESNTMRIKTLYRMALEAGDFQTVTVLHWFLDEQTSSTSELIDMVAQWKFAEGCPAAVLQLDHELGA